LLHLLAPAAQRIDLRLQCGPPLVQSTHLGTGTCRCSFRRDRRSPTTTEEDAAGSEGVAAVGAGLDYACAVTVRIQQRVLRAHPVRRCIGALHLETRVLERLEQ